MTEGFRLCLEASFLTPTPFKKDRTDTDKQDAVIRNVSSRVEWLTKSETAVQYERASAAEYERDAFAWVSRSQFTQTHKKLEKVYQRRYKNKKIWLDGRVAAFTSDSDPIFAQKLLVPANSRIVLVGDLHSSMSSLLNILGSLQSKCLFAEKESFKLISSCYMIFLGDIVDRGPYGIEIMTLLAQLQIANPDRVFVVNGNHEDCEMFRQYGYAREIVKQFETQNFMQYAAFLHYLPSVILLQMGEKMYQLCHGALPTPTIPNDGKILLRLRDMPVGSEIPYKFALLRTVKNVCAGKFVADNLKWGDFDGTVVGYKANKYRVTSEDSDTFVFGRDFVRRYLQDMKVDAIISGHQDRSNLTLLLPIDKNKSVDNRFELDPVYGKMDLYRPANYDTLVNQICLYEPGRDFLAANTSSCISAKGSRKSLKYDCYLQLYSVALCADLNCVTDGIKSVARRISIRTSRKSARQLCLGINRKKNCDAADEN